MTVIKTIQQMRLLDFNFFDGLKRVPSMNKKLKILFLRTVQ